MGPPGTPHGGGKHIIKQILEDYGLLILAVVIVILVMILGYFALRYLGYV